MRMGRQRRMMWTMASRKLVVGGEEVGEENEGSCVEVTEARVVVNVVGTVDSVATGTGEVSGFSFFHNSLLTI
jgi:hypothetical protein